VLFVYKKTSGDSRREVYFTLEIIQIAKGSVKGRIAFFTKCI